MSKDNKYYDYVKNLILENKKITGNEELVDAIIDDVFSKAQVVLNTISDQNVTEEFLKKTVSTSVITIIKRLGTKKQTESVTNELLEKINNAKHNENIKKEYVDNFINGFSTNKSALNTKNETYDLNLELNDNDSTETIDDSFLVYENIGEDDSDKIDSISGALDLNETNNDDYSIKQDLIEDSLKQFDIKDEVYPDENSEPESKFSTETSDCDTDEDIQNEEFLEIQNDNLDEIPQVIEDDDSLSEYDVIETDNDISNENLEIENSDVINDFEITDDNEELLAEVDSDITGDERLNDTNEYIDLESFDNQEELLEDNDSEVNLEDSITNIDNNTIDNIQNLSDYSIFEYIPTSSGNENNIISDAIVEKLSSLNLQEPELKILEIYKLKYVQNKSINDIAKILNLDTDEVITALNKMVDIV